MLALLGPDPIRYRLALRLADLLHSVGGDRAAIVWTDEFGSLVPHPFVVLDLTSDTPRRGVDGRILRTAWERGLPGVVDHPDLPRRAVPEAPRSAACVSLGSDGARTWFALVDAVVPRTPLSDEDRQTLLHLTGECAAVILHRDLLDERSMPGSADAFTGWSVLSDVDENPDAEERIGNRFLVLRLVRSLLDDDLTPDPESLSARIQALRTEFDCVHDEEEVDLWRAVLDSAEQDDPAALAEAVLEMGLRAEDLGELEGALEAFRSSYWVAALGGAVDAAVDAARYLGRSHRRAGRWDDSELWYVRAAEVARTFDSRAGEALALDGRAATLRARGNMPAARQVLTDALYSAEESGDPHALGSVHQHLMTFHHLVGEGTEAVEHGWQSVMTFRTRRDRLRALVSLAGILLDLKAVDLAEQAYSLAVERVEEGYYRIFALEGYAHAAALKGAREEYEQRYRAVTGAGWAAGGVEFQAQALLYRGRAYQALHDYEEAEEWYEQALTFATKAGLNAYAFQAEDALARLAAARTSGSVEEAAPAALPARTLAEVRGGLGALRQELASVAS